MQSDESSSDEDANKPSKSRLSDDSDVDGSPEPRKTTGSDSSAAEDVRRTDSDDDRFMHFHLLGIIGYITRSVR